jgi:hypothetical protein
MEDFIFYLIVSILVGSILFILNKKSNIEINTIENELLILRLNKFYLYFGYFLLLIGLLFSVLVFTYQNDLILSSILLLIFGGTGFFLVFLYKKHRIIISNDQIEIYNLLGNKKSIIWSDLKEIDFSFLKGALVLTNSKDEKVNIHQHIVGFKTVIQKIKEHTTLNIEKVKLPY